MVFLIVWMNPSHLFWIWDDLNKLSFMTFTLNECSVHVHHSQWHQSLLIRQSVCAKLRVFILILRSFKCHLIQTSWIQPVVGQRCQSPPQRATSFVQKSYFKKTYFYIQRSETIDKRVWLYLGSTAHTDAIILSFCTGNRGLIWKKCTCPNRKKDTFRSLCKLSSCCGFSGLSSERFFPGWR